MSELFKTFGIDWKLLLTQMLNFAILFYVLKRFAYAPILAMLEKRKQIIAKGLEDASNAEKSLQVADENAEEIKKQAKVDANSIVTDAQNEAWSFSTKAKNEALAEKIRIVESAQIDIETLKQKNEKKVLDSAVDHIIYGIKSILGEEMTPEMNTRIINKLTKS